MPLRKIVFYIWVEDEGLWKDPDTWYTELRNLQEDRNNTYKLQDGVRVSTLEGIRGL